MRYIWQNKDWTQWKYDVNALAGKVAEASYRVGCFNGALSQLGFDLKSEAGFATISNEIVESAAIEGEALNRTDVRSSVARRMELKIAGLPSASSRLVDARVDAMLDATRGWMKPITLKRLFSWHAAMFPTGFSGLSKIRVGRLRNDAQGPMRVISRYGSLERVHYEAPPAEQLRNEMAVLLDAVNDKGMEFPPLVRTALLHLHFLTLHPFDDGNGRIARTLTEYLLARMERSELRFYSLSSQIQKEKDYYYDELERAQRGTTDQTRWIDWFVSMHERAIESARTSLEAILQKARFWQRHSSDTFNDNQRKMLNKLLDGFTGNLTSSKWAKICKVSQDTAAREIRNLIDRSILVQFGQGRSTHYVISTTT